MNQPDTADQPLPEPGWYADPLDTGQERFWDGTVWTTRLRSAGGARPVQQSAQPLSGGQPPAGNVPATPDGVPLAGWWRRFGATLLDGTIILMLTLVAAAPLLPHLWDVLRVWYADFYQAVKVGAEPPQLIGEQYGLTGTYTSLFLINRGVGLVYGAGLHYFTGATLGMRVLRLRVVRFGQGRMTGGLPMAAAVLRNLVFQVAGWLWIAQLANCLWPLFNPNRQALHDLAARTQVVDVAGLTRYRVNEPGREVR